MMYYQPVIRIDYFLGMVPRHTSELELFMNRVFLSEETETAIALVQLALEVCLGERVFFKKKTITTSDGYTDKEKKYLFAGEIFTANKNHVFEMEIHIRRFDGPFWVVDDEGPRDGNGVFVVKIDGKEFYVCYSHKGRVGQKKITLLPVVGKLGHRPNIVLVRNVFGETWEEQKPWS